MKPIGLAIWGLHHQHPRWYWPLFQNLPQFKLRVDGNGDIYADAVDELIYGRLSNVLPA